jgi:hypothetical protein
MPLLVLDVTGDWYHVEFTDPQWGQRIGYVERKLVTVDGSSSNVTRPRAFSASTAATNASGQRVSLSTAMESHPSPNEGGRTLGTPGGVSNFATRSDSAPITPEPTRDAKKRLRVRIVNREDNATDYSYVVPGSWHSYSTANASCFRLGYTVNCNGSSTTSGSITPPRQFSAQVRGATLSLLLPDAQVAVVNCESKYALHFDYINRRSCRVPPVDEIAAEFDGNKAKLLWNVSINGQQMESETYKIVAILVQ